MSSQGQFWRDVLRRRNAFFGLWLGWPIASGIILMTFGSVLGFGAPEWFATLLLAIWFLVWLRISRLVTSMACPSCGKEAFAHPFFFMRHAKCQHCGYSYSMPNR
jgi:ribosomal protein L37E